jgi:hypothetical protein
MTAMHWLVHRLMQGICFSFVSVLHFRLQVDLQVVRSSKHFMSLSWQNFLSVDVSFFWGSIGSIGFVSFMVGSIGLVWLIFVSFYFVIFYFPGSIGVVWLVKLDELFVLVWFFDLSSIYIFSLVVEFWAGVSILDVEFLS